MAEFARKASEIDADGVTFHYSDAVRQAFAGLHQAVAGSEDFNSALLIELKDLAGEKEINVKALLPILVELGQETMRHV